MNLYKLLSNKYSWSYMFWSTIQQLIVGLSTFSIINSIKSANEQSQKDTIYWLIIFGLSLVFVYIPNVLATIRLEKWRINSFQNFINLFVKNNWGSSQVAHNSIRKEKEAWVTHEAYQSINEATNILSSLFEVVLSAFLNIGVIAYAIDKRIAIWYLASGILLIIINFSFKNKIKHKSLSLQNARKKMSEKLLSAWENILFGNKYNFQNWSNIFHARINKTEKEIVHYEFIRSIVSSSSVILAVLIIACGNGIIIYDNWNNWAIISALITTMPRQMQTIQFTFSLVIILLSWQGTKEQLSKLIEVLRLSKEFPIENSDQFISWDKIQINSNKENSSLFLKKENSSQCELTSIISKLKNYNNGRFTLRGPNGAGKSTLLRRVKQELEDSCFYLPAKFNDLAFNTEGLSQFSDGEKLKCVFQEIQTLPEVKYLLLDEWDANLDHQNMIAISKKIDELCHDIIIIESRHRCETSDIVIA